MLSVNFAPMADFDYGNDSNCVIDLVDQTIVADAQAPILLGASQQLAPGGSRILLRDNRLFSILLQEGEGIRSSSL